MLWKDILQETILFPSYPTDHSSSVYFANTHLSLTPELEYWLSSGP